MPKRKREPSGLVRVRCVCDHIGDHDKLKQCSRCRCWVHLSHCCMRDKVCGNFVCIYCAPDKWELLMPVGEPEEKNFR